MERLPNTRGCFCCGLENPAGLHLQVHTDRRIVETRFSLRPEFCGFKNTIHGGITATVLDEIMAWACGVGAKSFAYCAEMTVRFKKPAHPGAELVARGEVVESNRRLIQCRAELRDAAGELLAEATGKYTPLRGPLHDLMLADFLEDPSLVLGLKPTGATKTPPSPPAPMP